MFNNKNNNFKVEKLPGRGDGVVALKDFQPGDLIMEDHPMIVMPGNVFERDDPDYIERWLDKKINRLSCFDREKYFNLSDARSSDFDPSMNPSKTSLGIFYTNCMSFIENSAALFPTMAKTNHSCSPNAEFFHNSREYTQQLVATRSISKGEEITISYLHADKEHSEEKYIRQKYLKRWYSFICQCRTCNLDGELLRSDDSLRHSIKVLQTQNSSNLDLLELDELVDGLRATISKLTYRKQILELALDKALDENDLILSAKFLAEIESIDDIVNNEAYNCLDMSGKPIVTQNKVTFQSVHIDHSSFLFSNIISLK